MRIAAVAAALAGVVASFSVLAGPPQIAAGPTPTPVLELLAPGNLHYDEPNNIITWEDRSTGEDGHRLSVQFGSETRSFDVGPNVEQLQLPSDFRPGCPTPGASALIVVRAFAGSTEGPPESIGIHAICGPPFPTATAVPTATSLSPPGGTATATATTSAATAATSDNAAATPPLGLPETGSGGGTGAAFPWFGALALLAAAGLSGTLAAHV